MTDWAGEALDSPARDLRYQVYKHPRPVPGMTAEVGHAWQDFRRSSAAAQAAEAELRKALGHAEIALSGGVPVALRVVKSRPEERVTEDFFSPVLPPEREGED